MLLVTGGAGFIGSHLVDRLVARGDSVRVLDNFSTGRRDNLALTDRIELIDGDIRDAEIVRRATRDVDVVFHEAAIASVQRSIDDPVETFAVNVDGTLNVLLAARDAGCRRVVFASSAAVYGDEPTLPKTEAMTPQPISPYAVSKLTGEHLCAVFTRVYGLETVALRYFNVFGPRQDPRSPYSGVVARFFDACRAGAAPTIYGDGTQSRDFVPVANVVAANLLAADGPGAVGNVFNVATGQATTLSDMTHAPSRLFRVPALPRYTIAKRYKLSLMKENMYINHKFHKIREHHPYPLSPSQWLELTVLGWTT